MKFVHLLRFSAVALGGMVCSCTPYQQQGSLVGGLAGAGLGAAFGDDHQDVIGGAAAGAALGAGAAALHERSVRSQRQRRDYDRYGNPYQDQRYRQAPPGYGDREARSYERRDPAPAAGTYPVAERSATPNQVVSPYPPYGKIDVSGFRGGQLARDPKTGRIFQVP